MAKKYVQSVSDTSVLFTDDKGNTDKFDLVEPMPINEIVGTLSKEIAGRGDVTRSCLTAVLVMLNQTRMDGYKGQTIIGAKIPKELKNAVGEAEVTTFQPLFYAYWDAKNPMPDPMDVAATMAHNARRAGQWDKFISDQRNGGIYGNVKTYSLQYFAYFGYLPCVYLEGKPQTDKLMPVSAMAKAIAIAKAANVKPDALTGIAKALQEILDTVNKGELTESEVLLCEPIARELASVFKTIKDGFAAKATATAQGLPETGVALQEGDKVQAPEETLAQMAKLAFDKAAIKTTAKRGAKHAPVSTDKDAAPV